MVRPCLRYPGVAPCLACLCVSCPLWSRLLQVLHPRSDPRMIPVVLGGSASGANGLLPRCFRFWNLSPCEGPPFRPSPESLLGVLWAPAISCQKGGACGAALVLSRVLVCGPRASLCMALPHPFILPFLPQTSLECPPCPGTAQGTGNIPAFGQITGQGQKQPSEGQRA